MTLAPRLIRSIPGLALQRLVWSFVRRRELEYSTTTSRGWRITGNTRDWIQRNLYYFGRYAYPLRAVPRAQRLRRPLTAIQNVIFSKIDADSL